MFMNLLIFDLLNVNIEQVKIFAFSNQHCTFANNKSYLAYHDITTVLSIMVWTLVFLLQLKISDIYNITTYRLQTYRKLSIPSIRHAERKIFLVSRCIQMQRQGPRIFGSQPNCQFHKKIRAFTT